MQQPHTEIRLAGPHHVTDVAALSTANRHIFGRRPRIIYQEAQEGDCLYVALRKGLVVGFIRCAHRLNGVTWLHEFCVDERLRSMGIGEVLYQYFLEECRCMGRSEIRLKVRQQSPAIRFYIRHGFVAYGEEEDAWERRDKMRLPLSVPGVARSAS